MTAVGNIQSMLKGHLKRGSLLNKPDYDERLSLTRSPSILRNSESSRRKQERRRKSRHSDEDDYNQNSNSDDDQNQGRSSRGSIRFDDDPRRVFNYSKVLSI
jgi:hypothetical protein